MKNLALLALVLSPFLLAPSLEAEAAIKGSPFPPYLDQRFNEIEEEVEALPVTQSAKQSKLFSYEVAVDGGESTEDKDLGIDLPAGAVVTNVMVYINEKFTDSGTGSLKLECKGSGDILTYRDITLLNQNDLLNGQVAGASPAFSSMIYQDTAAVTTYDSIMTDCSLVARVRGDSGYVPLTGGKLTGIVEFFMGL